MYVSTLAILSFSTPEKLKIENLQFAGDTREGRAGPPPPCPVPTALPSLPPYRAALRPALPCSALAPLHALPSPIVSYGFRCQYRTDQPKHSELSIGALKNPRWQEIRPNSMDFPALLPDGSCLRTQHTVAHGHTTCMYAKTRVCARNAQECARASASSIKWPLIGTIISINPHIRVL